MEIDRHYYDETNRVRASPGKRGAEGVKRFADVDWMESMARKLDAEHLFNHAIAERELTREWQRGYSAFLRARKNRA